VNAGAPGANEQSTKHGAEPHARPDRRVHVGAGAPRRRTSRPESDRLARDSGHSRRTRACLLLVLEQGDEAAAPAIPARTDSYFGLVVTEAKQSPGSWSQLKTASCRTSMETTTPLTLANAATLPSGDEAPNCSTSGSCSRR
jgi:hypothetical protein